MENQYNCPNCNNPLLYDQDTDSYMCTSCGGFFAHEELASDEEKQGMVNNDFTDNFVEIICKLCGKKTIVNNDYSYDVCPFCFNNLIELNPRIVDFKPELIIEFKEDPTSFLSHLIDTLKAGGCPQELLNGIKFDSLKGLYVPFYRYLVENSYRCFLETVEINNRFGDDGFYYQEIDYVENLNVLCDATKTIPIKAVDAFANYDYKKQKMFFAKMLGKGFYTVSKYETHDKVWKDLKVITEEYTKNQMNKYVGKTEEIKRMHLNCDIKNIVKKFILLPVWVIETMYNDELHYIYVNGQTNRVASDIEFPQPQKKSLFGKEKPQNFQVEFVDEMKVKYKRFNNGIDYHNEVRKYDSNSATKDQRIGALRTK
ncbi:MAG: hypothetical protein IKR04_03605 [Clostridia bacterium]|nr:hypothetical protein [Clostridia bacterium]